MKFKLLEKLPPGRLPPGKFPPNKSPPEDCHPENCPRNIAPRKIAPFAKIATGKMPSLAHIIILHLESINKFYIFMLTYSIILVL